MSHIWFGVLTVECTTVCPQNATSKTGNRSLERHHDVAQDNDNFGRDYIDFDKFMRRRPRGHNVFLSAPVERERATHCGFGWANRCPGIQPFCRWCASRFYRGTDVDLPNEFVSAVVHGLILRGRTHVALGLERRRRFSR